MWWVVVTAERVMRTRSTVCGGAENDWFESIRWPNRIPTKVDLPSHLQSQCQQCMLVTFICPRSSKWDLVSDGNAYRQMYSANSTQLYRCTWLTTFIGNSTLPDDMKREFGRLLHNTSWCNMSGNAQYIFELAAIVCSIFTNCTRVHMTKYASCPDWRISPQWSDESTSIFASNYKQTRSSAGLLGHHLTAVIIHRLTAELTRHSNYITTLTIWALSSQ